MACALIGAAQGTLITRLRLPSFIVTLAGLLIFNGVLLIVLAFGPFSGYPTLTGPSAQPATRSTTSCGGTSAPAEGWIVMAVIVGALGLNLWLRDSRRRRSGLVAPPVGLTVVKIVLMAVGGHRRRGGVQRQPCRRRDARGGPVGDLHRPRRARGVDVPAPAHPVRALHLRHRRQPRGGAPRRDQGRLASAPGPSSCARSPPGSPACSTPRTWAACPTTSTAVSSSSTRWPPPSSGAPRCSAAGARPSTACSAGLVIGGIYNGMYLLGLAVQWEFIVTGGVLIGAVTIDALSRRSSTVARRRRSLTRRVRSTARVRCRRFRVGA